MRHSLRRPSAAMVVACLALLVALGGTSYATVLNVPRNSVGPLQLKRNAVGPSKVAPNAIRTGHVLDGSLLTDDFKPGQIPQGPKGDKGAKGDKGEKGDKGSPGVSGYELVETSLTIASSTAGFQSVSCPSGKKVLGGGAALNSVTSTGPRLVSSFPTTTGWSAASARATAGSWTMRVYAICGVVT